MDRAYRQSVRLVSMFVAALGVALVVTTIARGGGPLALGVIVGACFVLLGAAARGSPAA
ncbi:MAG TPA: hypothetical protein VNT32_09235 [Thermoleophilaceae bacterium]|nr:hypothetical protein [Thermoleophilaceae bacterium]